MQQLTKYIKSKKVTYGKYEYSRQYRTMVAMQWFFCAETDNISQIVLMTSFCVREYNEEGKTALMIAAENNSLKSLRYLLSFEGKMQNKYGFTALMAAAKSGKIDAVKILSSQEACLSLRSFYLNCPVGTTALQIAIAHKRDSVTSFLAELEAEDAGIPLNIKQWLHGQIHQPIYDRTYRTPLHYMVLRGEVEYVFKNHETYKRYAGIKDRAGRTALMYLIMNQELTLNIKLTKTKIIEKFITYFQLELRNITEKDIDDVPSGSSALIMAMILGVPIPMLLATMEVGIVNSQGKMASDYLPQYKIINQNAPKHTDGLKDDKKEGQFDIFKAELKEVLFGENDVRDVYIQKNNQLNQYGDDNSTILDSDESDIELKMLFQQFDREDSEQSKKNKQQNNNEEVDSQRKEEDNLIKSIINDGKILSHDDQLIKIQNIIHVKNANSIYHGLQKLRDKVIQAIEKEHNAQGKILSLQQQIQYYKQLIQQNIAKNAPLSNKIKDLQKQLIKLKGQFSIDNWTSMRDFGLDIGTLTEKSNIKNGFQQQYPDPVDTDSKEIQVQTDNGQIELVQGIVNNARKTLQSRKQVIKNLKQKILTHKKNFLQTIDYVYDHYTVKKNDISMHALTTLLQDRYDMPPLPRPVKNQNVLRSEPISNQFQTKLSDQSLQNIISSDDHLIPVSYDEHKAVIELKEYNDLVMDAEVFQENLQTVHMETKNLEQILADLKGQLLETFS